ncbi:hypothetical protein OAW68_04970 [Alphaproteobacteria bacterium]|nr:hypothetical protein [Alphaproteobacteria bacterium]
MLPAKQSLSQHQNSYLVQNKTDLMIGVIVFVTFAAIFGFYFVFNADNAHYYQKYFLSAIQIYCGYGPTILTVPDWVAVNTNGHGIDLSKVNCRLYEGAKVLEKSYHSGWHDAHVLLSYLIAISWKVFGLSQQSIFTINALIGGLCGLFIYFLPRTFGVPIWLSLVSLALIDWVAILQNSMLVRDFSKTPFLMGVIVLSALFLLSSRKFKLFKKLPDGLFESILTGLIIAIGTGFREDVIVALPFFAGILCLSVLLDKNRGVKFIGLNLAAVLLSYFLAGLLLDILNTTQLRGIQGTAHFIVLGLSQSFFERIGFDNVGYVVLPHYVDTLAWASIDWGSLGNTNYFSSMVGDYNDVGMAILADYVASLPYDFLMRSLTASAASVKYFWRIDYIILFFIFMFLLFTLRQHRTGFFLLATVMYFSAVVSLQFDFRHIQHLRYLEQSLIIIAFYKIYIGYKNNQLSFISRFKITTTISGGIFVFFTILCVGLIGMQNSQLKQLSKNYETRSWQASTLKDDRFWRVEDGFSKVNGIVKVSFDFSSCNEQKINIIQYSQNIGQRKFVFKKANDIGPVQSFYGLTYSPHITRTKYEYYTSCASNVSFAEVAESRDLPLSMFAPNMAAKTSFLKYFSDLKKIVFFSGK